MRTTAAAAYSLMFPRGNCVDSTLSDGLRCGSEAKSESSLIKIAFQVPKNLVTASWKRSLRRRLQPLGAGQKMFSATLDI